MKIDFKKLIKEAGLTDENQLDQAVIDAKGQESADINNGGLEAQIKYLLKINEIKDQKKALDFIIGAMD